MYEQGATMLSQWKRRAGEFYRHEDGPTAVEYAVMLALIIAVCMATISVLGGNANNTFKTVGNKLGSASS
jgi:pilus assembly protein Flp/PilA